VLRFAAEEVPNREAIEGPLLDELLPGLIRFLDYRPKLIRSVSTIVRQVASEFSVDFPLSRWPVWVG
jgi:hypothetical protein